jgi:hypothetical protein
MSGELFNSVFEKNVRNKILKKCKFKKLYKKFLKNKQESTYNNLINYLNYKFIDIVTYETSNNNTPPELNSGLLLVFDETGKKLIYNSYFIGTSMNTYARYVYGINNNSSTSGGWKLIFANIISKIFANNYTAPSQSNNTVSTTNTVSSKNKISSLTTGSDSTWKQTCFAGANFTVDTFSTFIDDCLTNGITHIILANIYIPDTELDGTNSATIKYSNSVDNWTSFSDTDKDNLINQMGTIKLMVSFGGSLTYPSGIQNLFTSTTYIDYSALGDALYGWMNLNKCLALDINITTMPTTNEYLNTGAIIQYFGNLSEYIIKQYTDITIISHSPAPNYFNNIYTYGPLYNNIECYYGSYIDWYNVLYIDGNGNSDYTYFDTIFITDILNSSSVSQLINANTINTSYWNIPYNKIIVGKIDNNDIYSVYSSPTDKFGYVDFYNADTRALSMNNFVTQTNNYNTDLTNWFNSAGICAYRYNPQDDPANSDNLDILSYFNAIGSLH